jgi:CRISPR system Cascade subunit CasC
MTAPRFLQIHTLQSYPAVLLNRDDSGLAKRLPFGGSTRTRVSSQCLKRHWRKAEDEYALETIGVPMGVRSRRIIERGIMQPLLDDGTHRGLVEAVAEVFMKQLFQESPKRKKAAGAEAEEAFEATTGQAVLFGWPEVEYLLGCARTLVKDAADAKAVRSAAEAFFKANDVKANLAAMKLHAGLESALFGRMVTSDLVANTEAAVYVAHAFTVHAEESESDYFTVVDDLKDRAGGDDAGSAGIFDMELTSGLFYGYVVVDVPGLISNLEGCRAEDWLEPSTDRALAGKVAEHLCHLIAKVSPGAKLGATAPFGWARLMLIEAGTRQPRSLANAFRKPVRLRDGMEDEARGCLADEIGKLDAAYGNGEVRRFTSVEDASIPGGERLPFDGLAAWAAGIVREGRA